MAEETRSSGSSRRRRSGKRQSDALKIEDAAERKAAIEAAVKKKLEWERKALQVVEHLLEDGITEEFFVDCGMHITPSHYKDIVEERFIIKLCGYPLCQNKLQNVPKQQYKISTRANKVYDITERKRFCSNFCYRASKYFEGQISKTPVWLREEERPPAIELLKKGASGYSGEEVKMISEGIKAIDIEHPVPAGSHNDSGSGSESSSDAEQEFVSSVLQENLSNAEKKAEREPSKSILKKRPNKRAQPKVLTTEDTINDTASQLNRARLDVLEDDIILDDIQVENPRHSQTGLIPENVQTSENVVGNSSSSQIVFLGVTQRGADQIRRLLAKSKQLIRNPADSVAAPESFLESLQQTFMEWRTQETLKLLHDSDSTFSNILQHTSPDNSEMEELDEDDLESANDSEAVLQRHSLNESLPFQSSRTAVKPLPSYKQLKEERLQMELKVKEFYEGKFSQVEEALTMQSGEEQYGRKSEENQQWVPTLPLVDSKAQQQIRTRIILEKLQKVLPDILGPLKIPLGDVFGKLRNLVKTFRLTNKNIIHRAPVWPLIAVVLLSVLSENIPVLAHSQQSKGYTQFLATLLEELHIKHEDLEDLMKIFRSSCHPHWSVCLFFPLVTLVITVPHRRSSGI